MNLSFRKAGTLLIAGLALAACSTESNDSPLTPPLALQEAPGAVDVTICKVYVDPDAAGDYEFDVSGANQSSVLLTAGDGTQDTDGNGSPNPLAGCVGDATEVVTVTRPGTLSVVELAAVAGTAIIQSVSVTPFDDCEGTGAITRSGTGIEIEFAADPDGAGELLPACALGAYQITFKNLPGVDEPETGVEGCTPGAWRNQDGTGRNGRNRWTGTPYDLTTTFEDVFGEGSIGNADLTLREALDFNSNSGGEALLKHAAAAALNAAHEDVDYPYTLEMVVQMFNEAWSDLEADDNETKDMFDVANNLGCPI